MSNFSTSELKPHYHKAVIDWQQKNFPDYNYLVKAWEKHWKSVPPIQMSAKVGELKDAVIEHGARRGQPKIEHAREMSGNMFYTACDIIKAQCSTELGSIQQHRMTIDQAISDEHRHSILRIMAEELRHGYQMFWVLDHDADWSPGGHDDVAKQTIEGLLAEELGTHVLDAFNIEFTSILDNMVYATIIDLVGKYQLSMQQVFSYAPMARSMGPMLVEENYHMGSGRKFLREVAIQAAQGKGAHTLDDLSRAFRIWYARGLEMFGNETGGTTALNFGFKDKDNATSQAEYRAEVEGIVDALNAAAIEVWKPGINPADARGLAALIRETHEPQQGIKPEQLVQLPHRGFYRRRGNEQYMYRSWDVLGRKLGEGGQDLDAAAYRKYLEGVLPASYLKTRDFADHLKHYADWQSGAAGGAKLF